MRNISDTIARMQSFRRQHAVDAPAEISSGLIPFTDFGSNPGHLKAYRHVPAGGLRKGAALVVVLHGCGPAAAGYDHSTGWTRLADEQGFAVLYPEQTKRNNPNGCFNWFDPRHSRRDAGEAQSIHDMVAATLQQHGNIDPRKVFVTGLSAGGAMAAVMLATYPEMFAAGAIIAGLPYGTAASVPQAFDRMRGHGFPDAQALEDLVRNASKHDGEWPRLSLWHGSADATVVPSNADAILMQWLSLHDVPATPTHMETVRGHQRQVWIDTSGREVVERYEIQGMGHGTPLDAVGAAQEVPAAYMLDVGLSSTRHIAAFWDLSPRPDRSVATKQKASHGWEQASSALAEPLSALGSIGRTIEDALRKAGLMR